MNAMIYRTIAFALLLLLGAGTLDVNAQILRIKRVDSSTTFETTFTGWRGFKNGTSVGIVVSPTTHCIGTQGPLSLNETPDMSKLVPSSGDMQAAIKAELETLREQGLPAQKVNGVPENFGVVIFENPNGERSYAFTIANNPLDGPTDDLVEVTVTSGMVTTSCVPSVAPGTTGTELRMGDWRFSRSEAFAKNWNASGGGKATLAITAVVPANCSGTGDPNSSMRAPMIGTTTVVVALQLGSEVTGTVGADGVLTVTAVPEDPAFSCDTGVYSPVSQFTNGFE